MTYETKVKIDDLCFVQQESLLTLTAEDWNEWVTDRLHNKDKIGSELGKGDYAPSEIFNKIIPYLEYAQRTTAYEGIVQCLDEAYEQKKSRSNDLWGDDSLNDLLFLTGTIEYQEDDEDPKPQDNYFNKKSDKIMRFLDVVESKPRSVDEKSLDLYATTLLSLGDINAKLPYEFWLRNLQRSPSRYAHICFGGAMVNSPYDAFKLLPHIDWSDEETRDQMFTYLSVMEDFDRDTAKAFEEHKAQLPKIAQDIIDDAKDFLR